MHTKRFYMFITSLLIMCGTYTPTYTVNASYHYTQKTREFLRYLGCKNAHTVPINKISQYHNPSNKKNKRSSGTKWITAGYANGLAIYLNEDLFAKQKEGVNLFTCAHEAAHHALKHPFQTQRNVLAIEREADITAARMLCKNNHSWVVSQKVAYLKKLVDAGQGHGTDGDHPTTGERYRYLNKILQERFSEHPRESAHVELKKLVQDIKHMFTGDDWKINVATICACLFLGTRLGNTKQPSRNRNRRRYA